MEFVKEFGKRILDDYVSFLNAAQYPVDKAGLVYVQEQDSWLPMTVKSRRMVLPTQEWLREPDWEQTIPFHPFSEHLSKGKSVILERTVRMVNASINTMLTELLTTMAMFASDTDRHADASTAAKSYLRLIPEAKKNFSTDARNFLLKHVDDTPEHSLLSIYLKRGDTLDGVKYDRVAMVSSPVRKALASEDATVFDFKFSSKKNREYLLTLLDHVLPQLATERGYTLGTNSPVAPYFVSLLTVFRDIRAAVWPHLTAMADVNADLRRFLTDNTWLDMIDNATEVSREIHALRDNMGEDEQGDVRLQANIASKEREREVSRERRETARAGQNVYADRLARGEEEARIRRSDREREEEERIPGWQRLSRRRRDYDDDYDDRRDSRRGRDDRDRDDRRGRDRDRDDRRDDRGRRDDRDYYDRDYRDDRRSRRDDDYDDRTASGIPLEAGRRTRR